MFIYTTAIRKIRSLTKRIKVIQGGTWGGKTYSIIPIIIDVAAKNPKEIITVVAETIPALKDGAVRIFKDVMQDTNRWVEDRWKQNPMEYTFANGTVIQFKSFDSVGKAKASGKRDRLFINEANHNSFETCDALMFRTEKEIWLDFNPDSEVWVDTEILTRKDAEILILNYQDNEAIPQTILDELIMKQEKAFYNIHGDWEDDRNIKSKYWANWCRVYVKGLTGNVEGLILSDWEIINSIPEEAEYLGSGTDFGKGGADPTSTTDYYWYDGKVIWDEVVYQSQLRDSDHIKLLNESNPHRRSLKMFCDNSEPSKIRELKLAGYNAVGDKKETIDYGLGLIKENSFYVTARSLNVLKELRSYKYDDDGKPIDMNNHAIDNGRYFYVGKFGVKQKQQGWGRSSAT